MCFKFHGHKNIEVFEENWIYMLNMVVTYGKFFKWADILSFESQRYVGQAKTSLRSNQAPKFYKSTFLLDGICA